MQSQSPLSEYARRVKRGERIILCDRNKPFAELRPLPVTADGRRPSGLANGRLSLPDGFNESDSEIEAPFNEPGDAE